MATTSLMNQASEIVKASRESEERRTDHVLVLILVDTTSPRSLVLPVRDAFDPRLPSGDVRVFAAGNRAAWERLPLPDVCVAIVGSRGAGIADEVSMLAQVGVPVAIVVESVLDAPRLSLGPDAAKLVSVVAGTNPEVVSDRLAEWLVGATNKSTAFAANFAFCRRVKTRELVRSFAMDNAMGGQTGKPGQIDLPLMLYNQTRLALDIAAVNGEPLAVRRIPEVLMAAGAGFGSRMMANTMGGQLPIIGPLFKAGFDFLGTQATGMALQRRHEKHELKASGEEVPPSIAAVWASRAASAARAKLASHKGEEVHASTKGTVRMLPTADDGGALVYEQEDV